MLLVGGKTGIGKSYWAVQLCYALSAGEDFLGFPVDKPRRCIYLQSEISRQRLKQRVRKIGTAYPGKDEELWVDTSYDLKLDSPKGIKRLQQYVERVLPDVVFFDPLRTFWAGSENNSDSYEMFMAGLREVQATHPFAVVLVHHVRKPASGEYGGNSTADMRGTSVITDRPDTIVTLAPLKGLTRMTFVKARNREDLPDPIDLAVDWDNGGIFVPSYSIAAGAQRDAQLIAFIGQREWRLSDLISAVEESFEMHEKDVERKLVKLEAKRIIVKRLDPAHHSRKLVKVVKGVM
jgi:hypothetical protein